MITEAYFKSMYTENSNTAEEKTSLKIAHTHQIMIKYHFF